MKHLKITKHFVLLFIIFLFASCSQTLTITINGTGSGSVISAPLGIQCAPECTHEFTSDIQVTLTAEAYIGSTFTGWGGGICSGTGPCTLALSSATTIFANFELIDLEISDLPTPYTNEIEIRDIRQGISTDYTLPPWQMIHDGFDIYPAQDLASFQAVCDGRIKKIYALPSQVIVYLECNGKYVFEYNFEAQDDLFGQDQLDAISVTEGQTVSTLDAIGKLVRPNQESHVHFSMYRNFVPICPEPYLLPATKTSMLNLLHIIHIGANLCYGPDTSPDNLLLPYVNELDMVSIRQGFSSPFSTSPWGVAHDGFDIYPDGDNKDFQASCEGDVQMAKIFQPTPGGNYEVKVVVDCDDYVFDPEYGGYFVPFSIEYIFKIMSSDFGDAENQLQNIAAQPGNHVIPRQYLGQLRTFGTDAHLQFNLVQFGSADYSMVESIPFCPAPYFNTFNTTSLNNLLHVDWPFAHLCYQE